MNILAGRRIVSGGVWIFAAIVGMAPRHLAAQTRAANGPVELQVDNLKTPLGIDDPAPRFSWQLHDSARGARQSAYEVMVATQPERPGAGKADVWSSGEIKSSQSLNVVYAGPALMPSKRYYWRVKLWDAAGKPYTSSTSSWWETGLLKQEAWQAHWIGYETAEEAAVRHASAIWIANPDAKPAPANEQAEQHFAYRTSVKLEKPVKHAALFATAQDTVSAWVNGKQVLTAAAFPPWHQMPWKKFVRADVTPMLTAGANVVAVEAVHYSGGHDAPPMIATLVVEYADGTTASFASGPGWKTAELGASSGAPSGWQQTAFDASAWKNAIAWSQPSTPEMGSQPAGNPWIPDSVKALRHDFLVSKAIKSARLYSTALGTYEMFLNGKRVSEDVMAPGWTDYRERVTYQTYDVTGMLAQGKNAIGALLAPGWYSTPLEWFQQPNNYGDTPPAMRAQLRVEHTDGSVEWIVTEPSWQAHTSHILSSELYDGETQDARQTFGNASSFSINAPADGWASSIAIQPNPLEIISQDFQPIRVERTVPAISVSQPKPGVYVYDFGQNLAGVERLRVSGPKGTNVRVRFAEILNSDGTLYTENLRTAKATDHFILAGTEVEEFTPQFTFHGFRYAEITGLPTAPGKDALAAVVIHTAAPFAAQLKTGSAMVNKLWSNILWGQRSNFVGVPTDCPQRDERLGWMADAQVFWRTASYNMDLAAFSRKFAGDMRGTQAGTPFFGIYAPGTATEQSSGFGPGWSDAGVIIPWTSWLQTGDTSVIEQNWDAMEKYLRAIESANPGGLWVNDPGIPFGDWLAPEGRTNQVLIATSSWAYDTTLMAEMAHATGRTADEQKYQQLFGKIKAAFEKKFVREDGLVLGADQGPNSMGERTHDVAHGTLDTQTGYVVALHMNLLPDNLRAAAAKKLADKIEANHGLLATGFLGTPYLLEELTKTGHADLAYKLLLNTQYPSWGYLIEHGATTTWERWNGDQMKNDPSMNSYNHYAYGAVADWIYRYAAGIDATPLDAGFHTVVLHPTFDARLGSVDFNYPSPYGTIHSDWKVQGSTVTWHVTIPGNTTGWLDLTAEQAAGFMIEGHSVSGSPVVQPATRNGSPGYEIQAGAYTFTSHL